MSQIDELFARSAAEVRRAVESMPEGEVAAVASASTRKTVLTTAAALAGVVIIALLGWSLLGSASAPPIDEPIVPAETDAMPWPRTPVEAGTYLSNSTTFGVPFSFTLEEVDGRMPWAELGRSPWEVGLVHPNATELGDRELVFMLAHRLSDPDNLRDATWPVTDIDGWLEAAGPAVIVDGPTEVSVAGRPAVHFSMAASAPCDDSGPGEVQNLPCDTLAYAAEGTGGQLFLEGTFPIYEVWWVPGVVDDAAFVAFAGAYPSSWNGWEPLVQSVIGSLGIGE